MTFYEEHIKNFSPYNTCFSFFILNLFSLQYNTREMKGIIAKR
jgi:hypothetical protein